MRTSKNIYMSVRNYKTDAIISFHNADNDLKTIKSRCINHREKINYFSKKSKTRLEFRLRNSSGLWKQFVTLTYPAQFSNNGKEIKKHINKFCQLLRNRNIKYFWVLEFQKRGAPHFHFCISTELDKQWVSNSWYKIVGSNDEKHLLAGTSCDIIKTENQLFGYMCAYMKKLSEQKSVPAFFQDVGRFWGCSREILEFTQRIFRTDDVKVFQHIIRPLKEHYKRYLKTHKINWKKTEYGFKYRDGSAMSKIFFMSNYFKEQMRFIYFKDAFAHKKTRLDTNLEHYVKYDSGVGHIF